MSQAQDAVRDLVFKTLKDLGAPNGELCCETLLIRDGYYVGRHFKFEHARAVWFVDANTFKFYGNDGALLKVLRLEELNATTTVAGDSVPTAEPEASRNAA